MAGSKGTMAPKFDIDDPKTLRDFKKAANKLTARTTRTKAAARRSLVADGIVTKRGHLTTKYK